MIGFLEDVAEGDSDFGERPFVSICRAVLMVDQSRVHVEPRALGYGAVRDATPSQTLFAMVHQALRTLWDQQSARASDRKKTITAEIREVENEIKKLVDRVIETENATLINAYEKRIGEAESRKIELAEKFDNCGRPLASFDTAFRTALTFLANPYKLWVSDRIDLKHMVLKFVFDGRLEYVRNSGFRTPLTSSPFRLLQAAKDEVGKVVHPARFERAAFAFGGPSKA